MVGYYKILNIIPCAIIGPYCLSVLLYSSVFSVNLELLIYPPPPHLSPFLSISLFSIKHLLYAVPCAGLTLSIYRLRTSWGQETVWPGPTYCVLRRSLANCIPWRRLCRWNSSWESWGSERGWALSEATLPIIADCYWTAPCPPRMGQDSTVSVAMKKPHFPLFISVLHFKLNSNSAELGFRCWGGRTMTRCCVPAGRVWKHGRNSMHVWRMISFQV